jgi:hypothetical protein
MLSAVFVSQARLNVEHGQRPNDMLPVSHTCFFTIDLPEYTTLEACTAKITYAMVCGMHPLSFEHFRLHCIDWSSLESTH